MRELSQVLRSVVLAVVVLVPLTSCTVVTDLLSDDLLMGLGTSPGVVIVAFNNETQGSAVMSAFESADVVGTQDARTFSVEVDANDVVNEVLECPVGLLTAVGATVVTDEGGASIEYEGLPVTVNESFSCGDVIEIRLSQRAVGDGVNYALTMRVIPG